MYRWYSRAVVCYAYLCDCRWNSECGGPIKEALADHVSSPSVYTGREAKDNAVTEQAAAIDKCIHDCRWFSRGWTLQELIAPGKLKFFDQDWHLIAERDSIHQTLEKVTGIHRDMLVAKLDWHSGDRVNHPSDYSVAQRMFWASKRQTSRKEDEAYCLLGLFGIHMPLLYGEGEQAFQRLQQEIIRTSTDQSVLAWEVLLDDRQYTTLPSLLAPSPANFGGKAQNIIAESRSGQRNPRRLSVH